MLRFYVRFWRRLHSEFATEHLISDMKWILQWIGLINGTTLSFLWSPATTLKAFFCQKYIFFLYKVVFVFTIWLTSCDILILKLVLVVRAILGVKFCLFGTCWLGVFCLFRPSSAYGDSREPRPRSRSPVHGRDSRDHRDSRDMRGESREPRPGPPREHEPRAPADDRYRGSESREKDPSYRCAHTKLYFVVLHFNQFCFPVTCRHLNNITVFHREEGYDRYYRGDYDYYRKKEEPYTERFREPWNGRRESEGRFDVYNRSET